jgi:hypothetical protein
VNTQSIRKQKKLRKGAIFTKYGGQSEIRTHGRLPPTAVFKTAALNHSAICPDIEREEGAFSVPFVACQGRKAINQDFSNIE